VKINKRALLIECAAAMATLAIAHPVELSAGTAARWSLQVNKVDAGDINLAPSFQIAIYENLLRELSKTKQFQQVLRDGDRNSADIRDLLFLKTTVERYTAGSETRRAVTTVTGATKLTVRAQLATRDGKTVLERTVNGNVRFMGSNLRATHNLASNMAKAIKRSSLPEAPSPALSQAINSTSSDEIVLVEFR
jgi:hypothetical protein